MTDINFLKQFAENKNTDSIGLKFVINNDGTHTCNLTVGGYSVPISSNDVEKLTLAQIIEKVFKDNE
jgi:hypothetical protein